jgi:histidyl-tRNA synthetase
VEAEAIEMVLLLLEAVGVDARLTVNSVGCGECRPRYVAALRDELSRLAPQLCEDCRRRTETNALRVLDCKVESCQPVIGGLPRITDHLCAACADHFARFRKYLEAATIPYTVVPRLVRGLDYYVKTAFEVVSGELGAQNALVGGGRYDGLSEILGGPPAHGFGFALGLDRLVMLLPEQLQGARPEDTDLFVAHMGEPAFDKALEIVRALRRDGFRCSLDFGGASLKSQLRLANRLNARYVLIIGEEELARGRFALKRLADSAQRDVSMAEMAACLRAEEAPCAPGQQSEPPRLPGR